MPPHFPYPPPSLDTPPGGDVCYSMFHYLIKPNMKTKTLILAALSAVVLAGCGGTIPGVPQEFREFFPYQTGDTIVFTNGQREEMLGVTGVHVAEDWDYCGYADTKAFLPAEMLFSTDTTSLFSFNGRLETFNMITCKIYIAIIERDRGNAFYGSFEKGDTSLMLEDVDNASVTRVTLEKGKGITSFYDANHDEEWVLKEIK